jgi:CspA family cold shock protein
MSEADDLLAAAWLRDLPSEAHASLGPAGIVFDHADGRRAGPYEISALETNGLGLQDEISESVLGAAWPRCPAHGRHPLVYAGEAWSCPHGAGTWPVGSLAEVPGATEPKVADDHVRWWSEERGWGVVAHRDGDVFVHFSVVEGVGYRSLAEDQPVAMVLSGHRQGRYRRAESVRPL